ncbi:IS5 family transposase [Saccharothrix mutabilis subsp. capreolus]|uniref:IS5 family transposase n=1 Tax=Saccharothrix mutabilis TaxID=33921 RepID=UPI0035EB1805
MVEAVHELDREVSVDSSIVRAHQHAHAAVPAARPRPRWAVGSCGGPTTRIHLACDGHGPPLSIVLSGGNVNDCTQFTQVMAGIAFRRPRPGRPATRPSRVIADKGYSTKVIRTHLRKRGIPATIPERRDQQSNRKRKGGAGGRTPAFDRTAYTRRNAVGRCFNKLKQFRAIATRFDKTATSYRGMLDLATLLIWL